MPTSTRPARLTGDATEGLLQCATHKLRGPFQKDMGLPVTGQIDAKTTQAITKSVVQE